MIDLVMVTAGTQGDIDKKHPPMGLLYIGSNLKKAGFDVRIHHVLGTNEQELEETCQTIARGKPLFVGVSVLSGMTTYCAAQFSKRLKELDPTIVILWGGHHPTLMAEQCVSEKYIDFVGTGEGEYTCVELARALESGSDLSAVKGLVYQQEGKPIRTAPRPLIDDLDALPLEWSLLHLEDYKIHQRNGDVVLSFFSSRGCPFVCGFCSTFEYSGRSWRAHSPDYVVNHLTHLKDTYGISSVYFSDDLFMVQKQRAYTILERLALKGITCSTLDVRAEMITDEMLQRFTDYGTNGIFIGWESGSDRLLKFMHKDLTFAQTTACAKRLAKYPKISVWLSGMVAIPTETREEQHQTINAGMDIHTILPNATVSLWRYMPLPGTQLFKQAVADGFEAPKTTEEWRRVDPQVDEYRITWLPWFTEQDDKNIEMTQQLSRSIYMRKANHPIKPLAWIKNGLAALLRYRVRHQYYRFMLDLALQRLLCNVYLWLSRQTYGRGNAEMRGQTSVSLGKTREVYHNELILDGTEGTANPYHRG